MAATRNKIFVLCTIYKMLILTGGELKCLENCALPSTIGDHLENACKEREVTQLASPGLRGSGDGVIAALS